MTSAHLLVLLAVVHANENGLARTPPMGWRSPQQRGRRASGARRRRGAAAAPPRRAASSDLGARAGGRLSRDVFANVTAVLRGRLGRHESWKLPWFVVGSAAVRRWVGRGSSSGRGRASSSGRGAAATRIVRGRIERRDGAGPNAARRGAVPESPARQPTSQVNLCIVGLDGAGKTTVLERAKAEFGSRLPALPPEKITPTVGMNLATLDLAGCRVTFWDLGGAARVRSLWSRYPRPRRDPLPSRNIHVVAAAPPRPDSSEGLTRRPRRYYADAHGWIFVVDAADADRLREARNAFAEACDHIDLRDAPCLVLANKADVAGCCGADELASLLEVRAKNTARRVVDLRRCSALENRGLRDAISFVVDQAREVATPLAEGGRG